MTRGSGGLAGSRARRCFHDLEMRSHPDQHAGWFWGPFQGMKKQTRPMVISHCRTRFVIIEDYRPSQVPGMPRVSVAPVPGPLRDYLCESCPAPSGRILCSVSRLSGRAWPRSQTEKSEGGGVPT